MKHLLTLSAALCLSACAAFSTPQQRYYGVVGFVTSTGQAAEAYVDWCLEQVAEHKCREKFPKINTATKTLDQAMKQADKVFISGESEYYDLSLSVAENAAMALRKLVKED